MLEEELDKWRNQKWAVRFETKTIFPIEDMEVIENVLVLYSGVNTDSSQNLLTVGEAYSLEGLG